MCGVCACVSVCLCVCACARFVGEGCGGVFGLDGCSWDISSCMHLTRMEVCAQARGENCCNKFFDLDFRKGATAVGV